MQILPDEIIYQIAALISPSALIKLSLCSRTLRRYILSDNRIWRAQYYKEWPAFFPAVRSTDDALFPAPTWIQTFLMRKLAELNIEKQRMTEMCHGIRYQFFQDLIFAYDETNKCLSISRGVRQRLQHFQNVHNFKDLRFKIRCGKHFVVYAHHDDAPTIHSFSVYGHYAATDVATTEDLFAIDDSHFIAVYTRDAELFEITPNNKITSKMKLQCKYENAFKQVYGRPGCFIIFEFDTMEKNCITWSMWRIVDSKPELVMSRKAQHEKGISSIDKATLVDADFLFISFKDDDCCYIYVYSFKEDASKFFGPLKFSHNNSAYSSAISIFYASAWNSMTSRFCDYSEIDLILCVYFIGTTLNTLACYSQQVKLGNHLAVKVIQISRSLLFISTQNIGDEEWFSFYRLIGIYNKFESWKRKGTGFADVCDINSHYLTINSTLYSLSSKEYPQIIEWLHELFM